MKTYIEPHMTEALARHELTELPSTEQLRHFRLARPGTGNLSLNIVFGPFGIVLAGDLTIGGPHGCVGGCGKSVGWFAGQLSEGYLCEKFFRRQWQAEAAVETLAVIIGELEDGTMGVEGMHDAFIEAGFATDELPGMDYPRADAGWLCAVQKRFAELFHAANVATQGTT
jgi:hypothetical protein